MARQDGEMEMKVPCIACGAEKRQEVATVYLVQNDSSPPCLSPASDQHAIKQRIIENRRNCVTMNAAQVITCSSAGELHHGLLYQLKPTMWFEYLYLNLGKYCTVRLLSSPFLETGFRKTFEQAVSRRAVYFPLCRMSAPSIDLSWAFITMPTESTKGWSKASGPSGQNSRRKSLS